MLRNIFREFDANGNGVLSSDELQALLVRLQISVERKYLSALLKKFDNNNNGVSNKFVKKKTLKSYCALQMYINIQMQF